MAYQPLPKVPPPSPSTPDSTPFNPYNRPAKPAETLWEKLLNTCILLLCYSIMGVVYCMFACLVCFTFYSCYIVIPMAFKLAWLGDGYENGFGRGIKATLVAWAAAMGVGSVIAGGQGQKRW